MEIKLSDLAVPRSTKPNRHSFIEGRTQVT